MKGEKFTLVTFFSLTPTKSGKIIGDIHLNNFLFIVVRA